MIRISHGFICSDFGIWVNLDDVRYISTDTPEDDEKGVSAIYLEFKDGTRFTLIIGQKEEIMSLFEELFP